jgi:hypothetical protein
MVHSSYFLVTNLRLIASNIFGRFLTALPLGRSPSLFFTGVGAGFPFAIVSPYSSYPELVALQVLGEWFFSTSALSN